MKKVTKKLTLNKKTIADLENKEMRKANGGGAPTFYTLCQTDCLRCPTNGISICEICM
jgi:natural product precursor